jgi:hypothetical protein
MHRGRASTTSETPPTNTKVWMVVNQSASYHSSDSILKLFKSLDDQKRTWHYRVLQPKHFIERPGR